MGISSLNHIASRPSTRNTHLPTSRVNTRETGHYGRIEARAKLQSAKGNKAPDWMLPTDWMYGGWPASGEIDIMEHVGYMTVFLGRCIQIVSMVCWAHNNRRE